MSRGHRCSGYQKEPERVYLPGAYLGHLPLYGKGKCPACGRVVALTPKGQRIVLHRSGA